MKKQPPANESAEAVALRKVAIAFGKKSSEPDDLDDDHDIAGNALNSKLLKAAVAYAKVANDEPINIFDGIKPRSYGNDRSAWAPLRRVRDWLIALADDEDTVIQIAADAKELADELTVAIPRLGGGKDR